jgi:hypothetical protein
MKNCAGVYLRHFVNSFINVCICIYKTAASFFHITVIDSIKYVVYAPENAWQYISSFLNAYQAVMDGLF